MISILLIGKGNLAHHLKKQFDEIDEIKCIQISSRKLEKLPEAKLAIIAVSDDAISEVSSKITTPLVVHTSGGQHLEVLQNNTNKGVFYPLQSFSKNRKVDFKNIPICIEASNEEDYNLLEKVGKLVSSKVNRITSKQRKTIHVAAVFANNFSNHMFGIAKEICDGDDIPFDILHPLIQETVEKIKEMDPKKAQTGPAIRKDQETIKKHLFLLPEKYQEIYKSITESIQNGD
ncbi:MAG: hypothetical protein CMB99_14380 [Flavobacteriaceae bacterium]|nr:hypothetical protein [Flavobacteriaceae bacterium]|tara:strand:- start:170472 stop:171167 length:696 start_codon:yes stop_codon:yes gene_type:complete